MSTLFIFVAGIVLVLMLMGALVVRVVRKPNPTTPPAAVTEAELARDFRVWMKEVFPPRVPLSRNPCIGRRQPCPCGSRWPTSSPRAGLPKSVMSCCGRKLAASPTFKGSPLSLRLVVREMARKHAQGNSAGTNAAVA